MSTLLHWLTTPEWSQVVKTLLHSLWQGALIAVALVLAMRRATNPHWRYRFSLAALVAIPVAGIITWATLNTSHRPLPLAIPPPVTPEATTPGTTFNRNPDIKVVLLTNHSPAPPPLHWTAWLALLWIVGAGAMLGRAGIKLAGAEHLRRSGQPLANAQVTQLLAEARRAVGLTRRIRVAATDKLTSPAVVGVLVPTLILPLSLISTLTPDQIRFILLHELAHIRRGDYFANLFQLFIEALLFFNPAVWWISHQVRREREACCDALAIELSGAPADYARTLVHVAENALESPPAVAPAFGDGREPSSLADRVQRLLVPGYRPSLRLTWRAMIGAFVLGATLLLLSAEGTRVAVAQITRPQPKAEQDNSTDTTTASAADSTGLSPTAEMVDRFGINDLVTVKFSGTIDGIPQHEERIKGDGSITLPLIGAVIAAGRTPAELQNEIHDRYVPAYYKRLTVVVTGEENISFVGGRVPVRRVYRGATSPAKERQSSGVFEQLTNRRAVGRTQADKPKTEVAQQSSESHRPLQSADGRLTQNILLGSDWLAREFQLNRQWDWHRADRSDPFREVKFNLSPRPAQLTPVRTPIVLTRGNSTVTIDPYNSSGMNSWTVDGQNQLYQQWFWYRVNETNAHKSQTSARVGSLAQPINGRSPLDHSSPKPNSLEVSGVNDKSRVEYNISAEETNRSTSALQQVETLPSDNTFSLSNPFTHQFNLGKPKSPVPIGPRIPAQLTFFKTYEIDGVLQKLQAMRFQLVVCSNKPLGELFRELSDQSEALDKDGVGFMFSVIPIRLRTILATIDPPLTNASLSEILAAIQGAPQLRLNGVNTNGLVTLQTITSFAQNYPKNKSEFETGQRQLPENAIRSVQTNSSELQISGLDGTSRVSYSLVDGIATVTKGGIVRFNDTTIRADSIQVNQKTGDLVASGNVRLEQPGGTNNTTKLELNIHSNLPPIQVLTVYTNMIYTSEKRRAIVNKLSQLQLERVAFDGLPLSSVVRTLVGEAKSRDPEGRGVNIIINPTVPSSDVGSVANVGDIHVTINPPLMNVSLADALDAVVKGASRPIKLSIEEYAAVISLKGQETTPLFMREFNLDPIMFTNRLAQKGWDFQNPANVTNTASAIRAVFADARIDLDPTKGKSVYYNRRGILLVRATSEELDRVETLLAELNRPDPQINIKIRFAEVTASELETLVPDLLTNGMPTTAPGWAGILTKPQMNQMLQRIQTRQSVRLLSEGQVTTVSDRQAQIQTVEIKTIVTDINPKALVPPGISTNIESLVITTNLAFGSTIDIVPAITPDGYNVALTVIPRITEFLGYDGIEHPTNTVVVYENGKKTSTEMPRPRFRTQQMTNDSVVRDGMTLILAFPPVQRAIKTKNQVPFLGDIPGVGRLFRSESSQTQTNILFVLVTPTIVAPAAKQPDASAINKDADTESFVTSTNLRPVFDRLRMIDYYERR